MSNEHTIYKRKIMIDESKLEVNVISEITLPTIELHGVCNVH